ncbi:hypothetical protein LXL04_015252 [Taraxacum kok-saghyz]
MTKQTTLHGFLYKRKNTSSSQNAEIPPEVVLDENVSPSTIPLSSPTQAPSPIPAPSVMPTCESQPKRTRTEINGIDLSTIERDPGMRTQIYDYPVNHQDTVRRAYLNLTPLQPTPSVYPKSGDIDHKRSFQERDTMANENLLLTDGFQKWKKVGGKTCAFLLHMGTGCTSFHNVAQKAWDDLLNEARDIRNTFEKFTDEDRKNNRLRLMAIIFSVRWCAFQAIAFRGHNEKTDSINKGNFLELREAIGNFNPELKELLRKAPTYALYTSPSIQKEILNLISTRVRRMICEEINGGKYCLLVDEARDECNKEQMSVVLRFVNKDDPKSANEPFRSVDVCHLVDKYYPQDFSVYEKDLLQIQLQHYEVDVVQNAEYKQLKSISELCQWLIKTGRVPNFHLIYRVATLILILPVSTATTERSFSAMNLVKTRLRNKMEDEFLNDSLVLYIEREIAEKIDLEVVLQDFKLAGDRRVPL